jgi:ferredoxin
MAYVVVQPCIGTRDTACEKVCPVNCFFNWEGHAMLYINPAECIDCGACVPECPVQAIFPKDEVPAQWTHYTQINSDATDAGQAYDLKAGLLAAGDTEAAAKLG